MIRISDHLRRMQKEVKILEAAQILLNEIDEEAMGLKDIEFDVSKDEKIQTIILLVKLNTKPALILADELRNLGFKRIQSEETVYKINLGHFDPEWRIEVEFE